MFVDSLHIFRHTSTFPLQIQTKFYPVILKTKSIIECMNFVLCMPARANQFVAPLFSCFFNNSTDNTLSISPATERLLHKDVFQQTKRFFMKIISENVQESPRYFLMILLQRKTNPFP